MNYQRLFDRHAIYNVVRAGIIGAGQYATAVVTQSVAVDRLDVPIVADVDVEAARGAFLAAGYVEDDIVVCENLASVMDELALGRRRLVVPDVMWLMEAPVDAIVEATGVPEAGALYASEAISYGKHVAMVNKEADAVVGPELAAQAREIGVVYSAVDGDQHGLLIGLVSWARELGLEVLAGAKFRNAEVVHDPMARTVLCGQHTMPVDDALAHWLEPIGHGEGAEALVGRREALAGIVGVHGADRVEMGIVANATGLLPDVETLHAPIVRTREIPQVLCPVDEGGVLGRRGVIDVVTCLRHPDGAGAGGGACIVVSCENDYSREMLMTKGLIPNAAGTAALIYRPYHLCGVETPITILMAGLLGVPTGGGALYPHVDVVARTRSDLPAGHVLGGDSSPQLEVLLVPGGPIGADRPLPLHMASGNALAADVPAGTVLTAAHVVPPTDSALWLVRADMDARFFG